MFCNDWVRPWKQCNDILVANYICLGDLPGVYWFLFYFFFQVRGIETVTTYDPRTGEFVINTPCESAQKYWIGGAAKVSSHFTYLSDMSFSFSIWFIYSYWLCIYFWLFQHATHTIVFSQLNINGTNQGVHAFIAQIRDEDGNICPSIRIADCGHKIGLNGVDNGRIWYSTHKSLCP